MVRQFYRCIIGIPERKTQENRAEALFKKNNAEN